MLPLSGLKSRFTSTAFTRRNQRSVAKKHLNTNKRLCLVIKEKLQINKSDKPAAKVVCQTQKLIFLSSSAVTSC